MSQVQEETQAAMEAAPQRKSGRAVFDGGRTVWEWQTATGVFERFVSEEQLSRLEASNLRLLDQPSQYEGCAIYGAEPARRKVPSREVKAAPSFGALRQFFRRLVPST